MPSLIEFWSELNVVEPPFIHPQDRAMFGQEREFEDTRSVNHEMFVQSKRFPGNDGFHLSLLPVPYIGNLTRAKVFILLLNPGFSLSNYLSMQDPLYRTLSVRNLLQQIDDDDFPFMSLNPALANTAGFDWWHKKLAGIAAEISAKRSVSYLAALREIANTIAAIELVPYRSKSFTAGRLLNELPSAVAARRFVQEDLLERAKRGNATIIVTRKAREWALPQEYAVIYEGGHTRGAHLGPDTLGGIAILERLGL